MGNLLGAPVTEKETERGCTNDGNHNIHHNHHNNNSNTSTSTTTEDDNVQFAVSSMQGWRVHMEDAHIAQARLFAAEPILGATTTTTSPAEAASSANNNNNNNATTTTNKWSKIPLPGHALFAVFDGHGGSYSALYAGRNLCRVLSRQPKFVQYAKLHAKTTAAGLLPTSSSSTTPTTQANNNNNNIKALVQLLEGALTDAFVDLDREICLALRGNKVPDADKPYHEEEQEDDDDDDNPENKQGSSRMDVEATSTSTTSTNNSVQLLEEEGDSGTTACVVLLTPHCIVCANAGDSRAILRQMSGQTIALSYDHKPDDEGEERRIRAAGGYVAGGRVEGDLAVSRGLGDFRFKDRNIVLMMGSHPNHSNATSNHDGNQTSAGGGGTVTRPGDQKVSPIPDIFVQLRNPAQDAFVMIACDGIWDVQTNEHASKLVNDVFQEGESDLGLICEEVCDICLRLGSKDNMTVLIFQFPGHVQQLRQKRQEQQQQHQLQQKAPPSSSSSHPPQSYHPQSQQQQLTTSGGGGGGVLSRRQAREAENNSSVFSTGGSMSLSQ